MIPSISIVMPALNEEANIARAIYNALVSLDLLGISGEIIVVNDGSSDQTAHIVTTLQKQHTNLRLISHPINLGIGKSFEDGAKSAKGDAITLLPGDAENDAREILQHLPLLQEVDFVIPYVINPRARAFHRRLLSLLYRTLINRLFAISLRYHNGTVLYRRAVLSSLSLSSSGFFFQSELLVRSIKAGWRYREVPYRILKREAGRSKALKLSSALGLIRDMTKLRLNPL